MYVIQLEGITLDLLIANSDKQILLLLDVFLIV